MRRGGEGRRELDEWSGKHRGRRGTLWMGMTHYCHVAPADNVALN